MRAYFCRVSFEDSICSESVYRKDSKKPIIDSRPSKIKLTTNRIIIGTAEKINNENNSGIANPPSEVSGLIETVRASVIISESIVSGRIYGLSNTIRVATVDSGTIHEIFERTVSIVEFIHRSKITHILILRISNYCQKPQPI